MTIKMVQQKTGTLIQIPKEAGGFLVAQRQCSLFVAELRADTGAAPSRQRHAHRTMSVSPPPPIRSITRLADAASMPKVRSVVIQAPTKEMCDAAVAEIQSLISGGPGESSSCCGVSQCLQGDRVIAWVGVAH